MKRDMRIILAISFYIIVISALLLFFLFHNFIPLRNNAADDPEETVLNFVNAYNSDDIELMLEYISSDKRTLIRDVLNAADDYSDADIKAALRMMPIASKFATYTNKDDFLPNIEVVIRDVEKKGKDCTVGIVASAKSVNAISVGFLVNLKYDLQEQTWLIDSAELDF